MCVRTRIYNVIHEPVSRAYSAGTTMSTHNIPPCPLYFSILCLFWTTFTIISIQCIRTATGPFQKYISAAVAMSSLLAQSLQAP